MAQFEKLKVENQQLQATAEDSLAEKSAELAELRVSLEKVGRELEDLRQNTEELKNQNSSLQDQLIIERQEKETVQEKYQNSLSSLMEKDGKWVEHPSNFNFTLLEGQGLHV